MKEMHLLGKKVILDECPVLLSYQPDADYERVWQVMAGEWKYEDGYLVGSCPGNYG